MLFKDCKNILYYFRCHSQGVYLPNAIHNIYVAITRKGDTIPDFFAIFFCSGGGGMRLQRIEDYGKMVSNLAQRGVDPE